MRSIHALVLFTLFILPSVVHAQGESGGLIPETSAARHGLTRSWYAQADINASSSRINAVSLHHGTLFATSDKGLIQAWNAETGEKLWAEQLGSGIHPASEVGASEKVAAVTHGTTLYMFERATGKSLGKRNLGGVPSAAPAVAGNFVYVPMRRELLEVHEILRDNDHAPTTYTSLGRSSFPPIAGYESIIWTTDKGHLYTISIAGGPRNQMEAYGGIGAGMSYHSPFVFVGSLGGYVYAFHEVNGRTLWRFTAEEAVRQAPIVVNDAVYVIPELGGMFRLNATTGIEEWHAPQIKRFVAAGKKRVYAMDAVDRMVVLDAASGARIDVLPIGGFTLPIANWSTDRIYLANDNGLVQCLREIDAKEPTSYDAPKPKAKEEKSSEKSRLKKADGDTAKGDEAKGDAAKSEPMKEAAPATTDKVDPFK